MGWERSQFDEILEFLFCAVKQSGKRVPFEGRFLLGSVLTYFIDIGRILNMMMYRKPAFKRILQFALWMIAAAFLLLSWWQLATNESYRQSAQLIPDLRGVVASTILMWIGHGLLTSLVYLNHAELGYNIDWQRSYRFWFLSQIAKYLPGGFWQFTTRALLYRNNGMPMSIAAASMVWELLVLLMAAVSVGMLGIELFTEDIRLLAGVISGLILAGCAASMFSFSWRLIRALGLRFSQVDTMIAMYETLGGARWKMLLKQYAVSCLVWLVMGGSFHLLLASTQPDHVLPVHQSIGVFALAWAIGLIVFVAPAGVGPREAAMVAMLAPAMGLTTAFAIALISRLQWTVTEGIHIVAASIFQFVARRRAGAVT
jgi:hypothetical protein